MADHVFDGATTSTGQIMRAIAAERDTYKAQRDQLLEAVRRLRGKCLGGDERAEAYAEYLDRELDEELAETVRLEAALFALADAIERGEG